MYTRCPHCLTVFVVGADQLKAAHGNVRCGTCLESFDAIPHLSDGPPQAPPPDTDATDTIATGSTTASSDEAIHPLPDADPEWTIHSETEDLVGKPDPAEPESAPDTAPGIESDAGPGTDAADESATEVVPDHEFETDALPIPETGPEAAGPRSAAEQLSSTLDALRAATSIADSGPSPDDQEPAEDQVPVVPPPPPGRDAGDTGREVSVPDEAQPDRESPLPEVLREEVEERALRTTARRRTVLYGIAALALFALLGVQYVFFMPEDAVKRYPQWRTSIESLCIRVGCVLPERRDPGRIRVVSRDVRVHPKIEGVMQIKATLTNSAPFRQPYPLVRFTLFNVNGQMIATRDFTPSEYLGRRVATSARLRPRTPFQMELDVLAPEEAAVSFEFSFL